MSESLCVPQLCAFHISSSAVSYVRANVRSMGSMQIAHCC